jgi:putative FmdB family regulatory protein
MPYYSYRCLDCRKRFDIFINYSEYGTKLVTCVHCGSTNVQRRINRVRIARSEESRLEDFSNMEDIDGLEEDPRALGKMMRKMGSEMGEEMGPEFHEVIDRLESGQSPEDIEASIPGLGEDPGGMGGMSGLDGMDDF